MTPQLSSQAETGSRMDATHSAAGSRRSTQIDRDNVSRLAVAWTYRTGEASESTRQPVKFEATPLVVDGTMYLSTPFGRVIALDPATGTQRWTFDAKVDRDGNWGDFANRGVSTWLDASAPAGAACRRRIFLGTIDARIIALDARTGALCGGFGTNGTDLAQARPAQLAVLRRGVRADVAAGGGATE